MKIEDTEYGKIETLFNRDEKFKVIVDDYRLPEFENIIEWEVSEKIDGTNIRVIYAPIMGVVFRGRKEKSQIPEHLLKWLKETFTLEKFQKTFPKITGSELVVIYGEGYGEKIQDIGKHYTGEGVSFRVFDIFIEDYENPLGGWWLESENIKNICDKLDIEIVPVIGMCSTDTIVSWFTSPDIERNFGSIVQMYENPDGKDIMMEGIVAKTKPFLYTRKGERLMFKLKLRDFREGRK